jgi:hypothetical protein
MTLRKPKFPPLRRAVRKSAPVASRPPAAPANEGPSNSAREPDDEPGAGEPADIGWRASSYDLKRGLDVVELATSLPPEVLDRLFKASKP